MKRSHAVQWLLVLLSACAPIGVSAPQTFDERLAAGIATAFAVRTSSVALFRQGLMSADDAQRVQAQADTAREALEAAKELHATDRAAGDARLAAETAALQRLQMHLNSRRPLPWTSVYR